MKWQSRIGEHRHRASIEHAKQRINVRLGNAIRQICVAFTIEGSRAGTGRVPALMTVPGAETIWARLTVRV